MKLIWGILLFFGTFFVHAQIMVDSDNYSVDKLIGEVLINSNCADTFNYTSYTGTDFGVNGIGYFNANGTDFHFKEGIILSTGKAKNSEGPNNIIYSTKPANWGGDDDLSEITGNEELFNATYIQFDFIPKTNSFSFGFLFASEEYNRSYQCIYSDAFAFILTGPDGKSTNLAVLPESEEVVSVTTIRPGVEGVCQAQNIDYFGAINSADSPISQYGQTVPLTASSMVIPGELYTIKLVIADNLDAELDSAVFLEASSFVSDVYLGEDRTLENGNPICKGEVIELNASVAAATGYKWFKSGIELTEFENMPNISVTDTGDYSVEVIFSPECSAKGSIVLQFIDAPKVANQPTDIISCDENRDGLGVFDFSKNRDLIFGNQDPDKFQVRFYNSFSDAEQFKNEIENINEFQITKPEEVIYASISFGGRCAVIVDFKITIQTISESPTILDDYSLCLDSSGQPQQPFPILSVMDSNGAFDFKWYKNEISTETEIEDAIEAQYSAQQPGTYYVVLRHRQYGCEFSLSTRVMPLLPPESLEVTTITDLFSDQTTVALFAEGEGERTYLYSVDNGDFGNSDRFIGLSPGTHTAYAQDSKGCGQISKSFFVIGYPKFFTPNNDGHNDVWEVKGLSEIDEAKVSIFDRYGSLVHQFMQGGFWDGTRFGKRLPSTDYWFKITYREEGATKEFTGHFALKR